eukprot:SAG31_NODE_9363_length_1289_cov_2.280672_2_plen_249_part_01
MISPPAQGHDSRSCAKRFRVAAKAVWAAVILQHPVHERVSDSAELSAQLAKIDRHLLHCAKGKCSNMHARMQSTCGPQGDAAAAIALLKGSLTASVAVGPEGSRADRKAATCCAEMAHLLQQLCGEYDHKYQTQYAQYWDIVFCGYLRILLRECLMTQNAAKRRAKVRQIHRWMRQKPNIRHRNTNKAEYDRPYVKVPSPSRTAVTPPPPPSANPGLRWWVHNRPSFIAARLASIPMGPRPSGYQSSR